MEKSLSIGQLAKATKVNLETLRYYERRGLLPEPLRSSSGYRQYPESEIKRIHFIKHAQGLGFSLKEIQELLAIKATTKASCQKTRTTVQGKIKDIDSKISLLEEIKKSLSTLEKQCAKKKPQTGCPIIEYLEREE